MAFTKKEVNIEKSEVVSEEKEKIVKKEVDNEPAFYDMIISAASSHTQNRKGYLYAHPHRLVFMPGDRLKQIPSIFKSVLDMNVVTVHSYGVKNGVPDRLAKSNDKTDYVYTITSAYNKDRKLIKWED